MDFQLSDDHRMLQDSLRGILARHSGEALMPEARALLDRAGHLRERLRGDGAHHVVEAQRPVRGGLDLRSEHGGHGGGPSGKHPAAEQLTAVEHVSRPSLT